MRQPVGALIQLRVGQRPRAARQRDGIGPQLNLSFDEPVHRLCISEAQRVEAALRRRRLVAQHHVTHRLLRRIDQRLQQRQIMPGHARDGVGLEQLARIAEDGLDSAFGVFDGRERQFELRGLLAERAAFHRQARQVAQRLVAAAQVVEHHLEQR